MIVSVVSHIIFDAPPPATTIYVVAYRPIIRLFTVNKWRIQLNETKSAHISFTWDNTNCKSNQQRYPGNRLCKILGRPPRQTDYMAQPHLEKRKRLDTKFRLGHYWLLDRKSLLSMRSKLLVYNTVFKPVWTYEDLVYRFGKRAIRVH